MLRDQTGINPSQARDEWNIGVVQQRIETIISNGLIAPIHWLAPNTWRILADPSVYQRADGRFCVLAERLNHWSGRGEIWSALLPTDRLLSDRDFKPFVRGLGHLSYPLVTMDGNIPYLTMEMAESTGLHLWRLTDDKPVYVGCLIERPVIDPTFYRGPDRWWLFCTMLDDRPNERLYLFYSDALTGPWRPHPKNPVKDNISNTRPAGPLIKLADDRLIRPTQDCTRTYGAGIAFNEIVDLDTQTFSETTIRELGPLDAYYCDGVHTIAAAGDYTIIDGKRWHEGFVRNLPRRVIAKSLKLRRVAMRDMMRQSIRFS